MSLYWWLTSWPQGFLISTELGSGRNLVAIEVATSGTLSVPCFPRDMTVCGACLRAWSCDIAQLLAGGWLCISASCSSVPTTGRWVTYLWDIRDREDTPVVEDSVVARVTETGYNCSWFTSSDWCWGWPLSTMCVVVVDLYPKEAYIPGEGGRTVPEQMEITRSLETGVEGLPSQPSWSCACQWPSKHPKKNNHHREG